MSLCPELYIAITNLQDMSFIYKKLISLRDQLEQNQTATVKLIITAKRSEATYNIYKSIQKSKELNKKHKFKKDEEYNKRASDKI